MCKCTGLEAGKARTFESTTECATAKCTRAERAGSKCPGAE
jgi:hypothetical protein